MWVNADWRSIFIGGANSKTSDFVQSLRQAQMLILKIRECIPAVKIFALLDLEQT